MLTDIFPHIALDPSFSFKTPLQYKNPDISDLERMVAANKPALCLIDVQRQFCDSSINGTEQTEAILSPLKKLKARFNALGLPVFIVYMDDENKGVNLAGGGLHKLTVNSGDILIAKDADSAFKASKWCSGPRLEDCLREQNIRSLFVAGTHFSLCVQETARDAAKKLDTFVVSDCTANGKTRAMVSPWHTIKDLVEHNVQFTMASHIMAALKQNHHAKCSALTIERSELALNA